MLVLGFVPQPNLRVRLVRLVWSMSSVGSEAELRDRQQNSPRLDRKKECGRDARAPAEQKAGVPARAPVNQKCGRDTRAPAKKMRAGRPAPRV